MRGRSLLLSALAGLLASACVRAAEEPELVAPGGGRFEIGGYGELQLRGLSDGFDANDWYLSQWAWVLNLEPEWNIAPDGFGPFDSISAFARIEVRYECVWTGCGLANSWRYFGDRATRAPADNWARRPHRALRRGDRPACARHSRAADPTVERRAPQHPLGAAHARGASSPGVPQATIDAAFGPLIDDLFTYKRIDGVGDRRHRRHARARPSAPGGRSRGSTRTARSPQLPSHIDRAALPPGDPGSLRPLGAAAPPARRASTPSTRTSARPSSRGTAARASTSRRS